MNIHEQIIAEIESAKNIIITSHKSPDGDSIGSSLGLLRFIERLGKKAIVCNPDPTPSYLQWLDTSSFLIMSEKPEEVEKTFESADLVFCLDYNSKDRVGPELHALLEDYEGKTVMIDHHPDPDDFASMQISEPIASSTAELIVELIEQSGNLDLLDSRIGTPLYVGIAADTGNFRYSGATPRTHEITAKLLAAGVENDQVHESMSDTNTASKLRLQGFAISQKMEIIEDYGVAIIALTKEELENYNYQKGDTDTLANQALTITGVKVAVLIKESDDKVKLSFRAKGDATVNVLASENFDGGGHEKAAGGISDESMLETLKKIKDLIPGYFIKTR